MSSLLRESISRHFSTIKKTRANYKACHDSFIDYVETTYPDADMSELFEKITLVDIEQACIRYFKNSKKASSTTAISRFLSAIDLLYFGYLKPRNVKCESLEGGCNNKKFVIAITNALNEELHTKMHLPLNEEDVKLIEANIKIDDDDTFVQLGQKIIYRLLITYGFKENRIIEMKYDDFKIDDKQLVIKDGEQAITNLKLDNALYSDIVRYLEIHKYPKRDYLFTNKVGKKLEPATIFSSLKRQIDKLNMPQFNPSSVALTGVSRVINCGFTVSEIKKFTGFETQKIEDVSEFLLLGKNIDEIINEKLK